MAPKAGNKAKASDNAGSSLWTVPAALEGVKSQTRAIFKVDAARVTRDDKEIGLSGIALTLESRIAAVGVVGRAVASLLLCEQEPVSGEPYRHKALNVVRLGPHLAADKAAEDATPTAEEHMAAVMLAFRSKPQVVVLEEACRVGEAAWAKVFGELLRSEGLRNFRGAVVVCADEETFTLRRACSERWADVQGGVVRQEAIPGKKFDVIEDVLALQRASQADDMAGGKRAGKGRRKDAEAAEYFVAPLEEARALSDFIFEEDLVRKATKEGWTVSLLTETIADGTRTLLGYICYKKIPQRAEVYIARLAVPMKQRKLGYAGKLVRWLLSDAARLSKSECASITCSAVDTVIPFYHSLGFAAATPPPEEAGECEEDPQTWMALPNKSLV